MDALPTPGRVHRVVTMCLQLTLLLGVVLFLLQARWVVAGLTSAIILITLLPRLAGRKLAVYIPPEFELLAVMFVYASLFLGEVHGYYTRFWWWDVVLHAGSGLLLGILGFLLVYVLNERQDIDLHMRPRFVALFAFMFAVGIGALWEIFEFGMDQIFGMNMQKSGLMDTMWDLIVDTVGAATISVAGWGYLRTTGNRSFLEQWILRFIEANPRLFRAGNDD